MVGLLRLNTFLLGTINSYTYVLKPKYNHVKHVLFFFLIYLNVTTANFFSNFLIQLTLGYNYQTSVYIISVYTNYIYYHY